MHGVDDIDGLQGMLPRTLKHVFQLLEKRAAKSDQSSVAGGVSSKSLTVIISALEVYCESLRDLLSAETGNPPRLKIRTRKDGSVYAASLLPIVCHMLLR